VYSGLLFQGSDGFSYASLLIPGSLMFAGILVWFLPMTLARSMTGYKGKIEDSSDEIGPEQFASIAFLVLALYLSYRVLSDGTYWLYYYFNYEKYGLAEIGIDASASMYATSIEAIFLIVMLLGRKGIFQLFKKLRS